MAKEYILFLRLSYSFCARLLEICDMFLRTLGSDESSHGFFKWTNHLGRASFEAADFAIVDCERLLECLFCQSLLLRTWPVRLFFVENFEWRLRVLLLSFSALLF